MNRQHIKTHLKRKDEEIKDLENSTEPQSGTLMIRQATGGAGADHIQLKVKTAAGPKQLQSPDLSCCSWWWAAGGDTHIGPESSDKTVWLGYEPPPDRTQPETLSYVRVFFCNLRTDAAHVARIPTAGPTGRRRGDANDANRSYGRTPHAFSVDAVWLKTWIKKQFELVTET